MEGNKQISLTVVKSKLCLHLLSHCTDSSLVFLTTKTCTQCTALPQSCWGLTFLQFCFSQLAGIHSLVLPIWSFNCYFHVFKHSNSIWKESLWPGFVCSSCLFLFASTITFLRNHIQRAVKFCMS